MVEDIPEEPTLRAPRRGAAKPMLHVHNGDVRRGGTSPVGRHRRHLRLGRGPPRGAGPARTEPRTVAATPPLPRGVWLGGVRRGRGPPPPLGLGPGLAFGVWGGGPLVRARPVRPAHPHPSPRLVLQAQPGRHGAEPDLHRRVPGVLRFCGLGQLTPDQIGSLLDARHPVGPAEVELARTAWRAFTSPDPPRSSRSWPAICRRYRSSPGALVRHLEQFPSVRNGLNRTENQALSAVAAGHATPAEIFAAVADMEERPFMGDSTFWSYLKGLAGGPDAPADDRAR